MTETTVQPGPRGWRLLLLVSTALAYMASIWLANTTREGFDNVIMIWMPGGVALAGLIVLGRRYWPLIAAADLAGHLLFAADPTPYVFMPFSAATNTLGALLGASVAQRILGSEGVAFSQRTCVAVVAGSFVVAVASAPLGVAGLVYSGITPAAAYFPAISKWIAADLFGALLITPPLTLIYGRWQQLRQQRRDSDANWPEYAAWALAVLVFAVVLLLLRPDAPQFALGFTGVPLALLIWGAVRFPPLFSAVASLITGVGLVLAVGNELFGFPSPETHPDSLVLLFFLCTIAVAPLFLAAAQFERRLAARSLIRAKRHLERRVAERTADLRASNQQLTQALGDLRETQQALIEREKLAALGGLVSGVAHEVNTPVGVAVTSASYLVAALAELRGLVGAGKLSKAQLQKFLDDGERAAELVERGLRRTAELVASFKQIAVDDSIRERRRFELGGFLDELVRSLRVLHKTAGIELRCPHGIELDSYPGPLFQVISHLVANAVQHGYPDGARAQVFIEATSAGAQLLLRVRDAGIGMSPDIARRVFEPFFTTQRGRGSTGLGLHVAYNLVTGVLGGRITLNTAPGQGTEFCIELPKIAASAVTNPADQGVPASAAGD